MPRNNPIRPQFLVIEINDGGASGGPSSRSEVENYLASSVHWAKARSDFVSKDWEPGEYMEYPCGWVICIKG